ncbi:MAG: deoxyribonuclease IV [Gemmatimonadaceae bacterium]
MQIFSKQASRWAERVCADDECRDFRSALADTAVRFTCAHDSYLINLASPVPALRAKSLEAFISELHRCHALGLDALVSHPGNFMDNRASGIARNADAITEALERTPGDTIICLETTSGAGTVIGSTFEELATLIALVPPPLSRRLGVCLDTCHVYSAGYDLVNDYDGVMARFDDTIGLGRLHVVHCNDSKTPFGSRRDRHELIGDGALGIEPFRRLVNDRRLTEAAKIIETPKGEDATTTDLRMLNLLRGLRTPVKGFRKRRRRATPPSGGSSTTRSAALDRRR